MRTLLLTLSLGLASAASAQGAEHLIGRPYAGLPGQWAELGGGTLRGLPGDDRTYTFLSLRRLDSPDALVIYDRIDQMKDDRYPISTVLAALVVDDVRDGEMVASFECELRDGPDGDRVVAVVGESVLDEAAYVYRFGPVRLAWRLDRAAVQFAPVDASLVVCPDISPVD